MIDECKASRVYIIITSLCKSPSGIEEELVQQPEKEREHYYTAMRHATVTTKVISICFLNQHNKVLRNKRMSELIKRNIMCRKPSQGQYVQNAVITKLVFFD